MPPPPPARAAETLLRVLTEAGLPLPDVLECGDDEVVALYHEHKLAVVVELGEDATSEARP